MSRAAFTSSCGDPFVLLLGLKLFQERWYDEVDHYYVNINNHCGVPKEVISELLAKISLDPKMHLIYHPRGRGNGPPITEMLQTCLEDNIVLIEDDFYVFDSGAINKCFQLIESDLTDMVGSPRFSCGMEIADAAKTKYGLDYTGYGDCGPNFWPTGFFCKRKDLLKTDLNFGSITFQPGQYCKELDYTFKEINHGDTFVWGCIQLRAMGLRSSNIPQHHASPSELTDKETGEQNWHPSQSWFPWIHGGSLSAGWSGYLSGNMPDLSNENAVLEIETRIAFWTIASDVIEGFDEFKKQYKQGIENLLNGDSRLKRDRVNQKITLYRELMRI